MFTNRQVADNLMYEIPHEEIISHFFLLVGTIAKITKQYLKNMTKEFDVGSIFTLNLSSLGTNYYIQVNSLLVLQNLLRHKKAATFFRHTSKLF